MKRYLLLCLLFVLVGCSANDDSSYIKDMEMLKDEINTLKDENIRLKGIVNELETLVELNKSHLNQFETNSIEVEQKLNILDERHFEVQELNTSTHRLNRYIKKMPNYKEMTCYIYDYDMNNNTIIVDEFEWINMDDHERIMELGLDSRYDFPNGYYIYNEEEKTEKYIIPTDTCFYILDSTTRLQFADKDKFAKRLQKYIGLFRIILIDDNIIEVSEIYVP